MRSDPSFTECIDRRTARQKTKCGLCPNVATKAKAIAGVNLCQACRKRLAEIKKDAMKGKRPPSDDTAIITEDPACESLYGDIAV